MLKNFQLAAAILLLSFAIPATASPVGAPQKKALAKRHAKMIPARHNAGRPNHP